MFAVRYAPEQARTRVEERRIELKVPRVKNVLKAVLHFTEVTQKSQDSATKTNERRRPRFV